MIETNEPKDGDFIAYIEQLQKQQVARLHGTAAAHEMQAPPAHPAAPKRARSAGRSQHAIPGLAGAVVPLFIGLAIALHWFVGGSGMPALLIAVALVAYGAKQLQRIRRRQAEEHSQAAARVATLLGHIRK